MPLKQRIRTVLSFPPRRWTDMLVIGAIAMRVELALRGGGVDRAARLGHLRLGLTGSSAPRATYTPESLSARDIEKLDTAWRLLRHGPFNGTCLRRAIVGGYLLRRHSPVLRIGVAKSGGTIEAHAWVEVDGVSLDPEGSDRYLVLSEPWRIS
ncbi:lasso peptide biosynthesis B2 protein [Paramicrobacterium humi]|nr:lasso peptide biosynthesis B2 protein [Microbacterium humi]